MDKINVMLIEDNPGHARLIKEMLKEARSAVYALQVFDRLATGQKALLSDLFTVVLLDLNLPDSEGLETLTQIHASDPNVVVIILTSLDDEETAVEALRKGAQDYLVKGQLNPDLLLRSIQYSIERKRIEQDLVKSKRELEIKTIDLEETNVALRVLLKKRDEDKNELEKRLVFNAKGLIEPFLKKLKSSGLNAKQLSCVDIIEFNLNGIISPLMRGLSINHITLTPTEIQIANLVRFGKSTKDIAMLLNLSSRTIEVHRNNIRKKINLTNKKINLRTYLQSLPKDFIP